MTEEKIATLISLYEDVIPKSRDTESFLLEILTACDGSVKNASLMLNESLGVARKVDCNIGKRKRDTGNSDNRCYKVQKSLNQFIEDDAKKFRPISADRRAKTSNRAIELFSKEDVESTIGYVTMHEKALPEEFANSLLRQLMDDLEGFAPYEFHLFGNKCSSNHTSKKYSSDPAILDGRDKIYYNNRRGTVYEYNDLLKATQLLIEDIVNETIKKFKPLPFQISSPNWKGDVVLVNKYGKSDHLMWHSDRLTSIGPQPIVASLSLGCVREFRIRRCYPSDSQIYVVRPPHNSLIIMHAGFQEEYRHSVHQQTNNRATNLHPISKDVRFNLTYRDYPKKYITNAPRCPKCDNPMDLRRAFKDPERRGQYIWQCSSHYSGVECGGVRLADFNRNSLVVEKNAGEGSRWLADDDWEAKEAQKNGTELPR